MENSSSPVAPLTDGEADVRKEFRRRNSIWDTYSAKASEVSDCLDAGWAIHKELKFRTRMQRLRDASTRLANRWWILLYKMGYEELNVGSEFRILLKKRPERPAEKKFSVFAKDDETIIVTICIAQESLKVKNLKAELESFSDAKSDVSAAIKSFYGSEFRPKILWFVVTENVIWRPIDIALADECKLRRVTELELPYFTQLADHLGKAARYQFLAEFLKDQKIPELEGVTVPATRSRLGGETFYSFVISARHLLKIAFVNHRTLADPEGFPTYQRLIQKSRLKEIANFIEDGGYFPNNLLINFPKKPRFDILHKDSTADVHHGLLYLPSTYKSAWVIDGQHRLYGYAGLPKRFLDDKLIVVAFQEMPKSEEATLFVTINHEQRPVPKTLLDDLEGQLLWESDDPSERINAICARVVQELARELGGPLYNRVTAEGIKSTEKVCLTVPQIKIALKRTGILGSVQDKAYVKGALCGSSDSATLARAHRVLSLYFSQIMNADLERWDRGRAGKICSNEGLQGFILLLRDLIDFCIPEPDHALLLSEQDLVERLMPALEPILDFIRKGVGVDALLTVRFGSGGPREYLFRLARIVRERFSEFSPADYSDWELAQSEEGRTTADRQIQDINSSVQRHIFRVFRAMYGEKNSAYWEKGVTSSEMKTNAYRKSVDYAVDERGPLESYLDFIELKKIIEKSDRWSLFKDVLDIPLPGDKGLAKNIGWMDRINELRRISAHSVDGRRYKAEDFPLIDHVARCLAERLQDYDYESISKKYGDATA